MVIVLACLTFASCDDFLSKNPDNRSKPDTPETIAGLLVSAYPEYSHVWFCELMSDNTVDVGPSAVTAEMWMKQAYKWEQITDDQQDSPDGYWYSCYAAIASANHALEAIAQLEEEGSYPLSKLNPLKGEALLCRAYAHFMLVNLFAEHYDPATAASTSGIPYITEPEKKPYVEYTRQSVEEVYRLIENDIKEGFPLIKDETYEAPKWHFNRQAAATFISRYYLYRGLSGDWDKVIQYTDIAMNDNPTPYLREWLISSGESADVFGVNYSRSNNPANFLITSSVSSAYRAWYYRYSMDLNLLRQRVVYGDPHPTANSIQNNYALINQAYGNSELGCYSIFKYKEEFKRDGINVNYGLPYAMNTPIVVEEALFNRIEAEVMKENYDKAIEYLNKYYATRVINYNSVRHNVTDAAINRAANLAPKITPHFALNDKQKNYLKCIVNVRASEFVSEGRRWFDIKRMHIPVIHTVFGGSPETLEANDPRRIISLPQDVDNMAFVPEGTLLPPDKNFPITPIITLLENTNE